MDDIALREVQEEARLRVACLDLALKHYQQGLGQQTVWEIAEDIHSWAARRTPSHIKVVAIGDVVRQQPQQEAQPMQIRDNEQFDITIEVDDAKGFAITGDQLTVTSADETVATVQQGNDSQTYTIVAGNPGSTVITFDAGTDDNGNAVTATEAVDVVPGNVATIRLTEGTAVPQGSAQPAAGADQTAGAAEPGADPTANQSV